MLYGTCILQWYNYYTSGFKDPLATRLLVAWVMILDTVHTACTIYMLWDFTVSNFGNPAVFTKSSWVFPTTPIFIVLASFPIQQFLAWRIKGLSKSWILFCIISVLSLTQAACGFAGGIMANIIVDPAAFKKLVGVADAWVSVSVFTDILISGLLLFYLRRCRTGFKKTDSVISSLVRMIIETCLIGAVFCLVDVIVFTTHTDTNLHFLFALPQGRIYTNTLMLTLNSRTDFRNELNSGNAQSINLSHTGPQVYKPTEVSIAVSRDVQMDKMGGDSQSHGDSFFDDNKITTVA